MDLKERLFCVLGRVEVNMCNICLEDFFPLFVDLQLILVYQYSGLCKK